MISNVNEKWGDTCKWIFVCLLTICFSPIYAQETIGTQPSAPSPNHSELTTQLPSEASSQEDYPGLVNKPFELKNANALNEGILRGPGGDPIAGLDVPVSDGIEVVFFVVMVYGLLLFTMKKRKRMKKSLLIGLLILFGISGNVSAQQIKVVENYTFGGDDNTSTTVYPIISPTTPGDFTTAYSFKSATGSAPIEGQYALVRGLGQYGSLFGAWISNLFDHTHPESNLGYYMLLNALAPVSGNYAIVFQRNFKACPNTRMYSQVWTANMIKKDADLTALQKPKFDPIMNIVVTNASSTLMTSGANSPIIPRAGVWTQWKEDFMNDASQTLTLTLKDTQPQTDGNDLAVDDIGFGAYLPTITASGAGTFCSGSNLNLTADATGYYNNSITDNFSDGGAAQWLYSSDGGTTWTKVGSELSLVAAPHTYTYTGTANPGLYRLAIGSKASLALPCYDCCCAVSNTLTVNQTTVTTMYWKRNTGNKNWNDPANWEDVNGASLSIVPSACTDVHIPGNATYYPSLYTDTTTGSAVCHNIYFHFGSEVARTDLLTYNYAFVQYNFGYTPATINGDIANNGNGSYSATPMKRGQWYALSAPLKKIASGDFSVGGFPNMWQQSFKSSPNQAGATGEWYTPKNTNSWDIGLQHNAISIWAGDHLAELGENDHTNLDALKGIFEMPYFENTAISNLHRIHSYDGVKSSFQYYYKVAGLPLAGTNGYPAYPAGTLVRGLESYRFIFDGTLINNAGIMVYRVTVPTGTDVMIGNPFLSSLKFSTFYAMNSSKIENYYRLFEGTVFNTYTPSSGQQDLIASFQGFFINTKGSIGGTVVLDFPVTASVTRGQNIAHQLKSASKGGLKENVIQLTASNAKANSNVLLPLNSGLIGSNAPQLFMNDPSSASSLQFYVKNQDGMKNAVQYEDRDDIELNLGIVSESKEPATISISNIENVSATSLTLTDLKTNKTVNLFETSSYEFVNDPDFKGERFVLKASKLKAPTGIETTVNELFNVSVSAQTLYVQSSGTISEVSVTSAQGQRIHDAQSVNSHYFTREVQAAPGVYIVSVKLQNGEIKNAKVIIK